MKVKGAIMDEYVFELDDAIFNNSNRDIIKRVDFKSLEEFYRYCDDIIKSRISLIKKYNMVDYNDCLNSDLYELNSLQPIIIDGCFNDSYIIDEFAYYFENKYDLHSLKNKYGILIIDL
jgi:hypothetical protein